MTDDLVPLLGFSLALLAIVGVGEALRVVLGVAPEASRRAVHLLTGLTTALAVPLFSGPGPIYLLAVLFVGVNFASVARGWFPGMHAIRRRSLGTVTFPLALIVALFVCWTLDPGRLYVLQIAFVVLALADPLASWVGMGLKRPGRLLVGVNEKSVAGSSAFFGATWALVSGGLALAGTPWSATETVLVGFVVAAIATGAEALATGGWDNLFIVLAVIAPLVWLDARPGDVPLHALALAVAVAFLAASRLVRFLTLDGALAAAGLAFSVVAFGGWAWTVPAFTFFVLSSLLSKAGRRRKFAAERLAEKGSIRDAGQVYANGGVAWVLLLAHAVFPASDLLFWGFVGAFAAAAADTWGTEIGTMVGGPTRSIWSGRRVAPGTSGGVSVAGTLGALTGAAVVFASLVPFAAPYLGPLSWGAAALVVVGGGFAASLLDSLLGATAQALYRDAATGLVTERRAVEALGAERGWVWVTNDRVNLACTMAGAAVPLAWLLVA